LEIVEPILGEDCLRWFDKTFDLLFGAQVRERHR
jgi:hypothetical protein